jgi:lipopolysaccharide/colanic/teichoic acid biosynthesis glycosyltransferase
VQHISSVTINVLHENERLAKTTQPLCLNTEQRRAKRIFDVCLAVTVLLVTLPITLLIAIAMKLESEGPLISKHQRVGENGRLFSLYKFRTTLAKREDLRAALNANDTAGRVDDRFLTGVGRILRASYLDELPQLFNVVMGDLSFVGPRPELPWLAERYESWQRQRLIVPQGIMGWQQLHGRGARAQASHRSVELDLHYIQNYSLLFDLHIMLLTLKQLFNGAA